MTMKLADAAFFTGRHLVAAAASAVFVSAGPIVLYAILVVVGAVFYGDIGGPLNFIIVPVFSVLLGVGTTCLVYAPLCFGFEYWRKRSRLPVWLPPLLFFAASLLFFSMLFLWAPPPPLIHTGVAAAFAAFFTLGFCIYWLLATFSDAIISFVRKQLHRPSTKHDSLNSDLNSPA